MRFQCQLVGLLPSLSDVEEPIDLWTSIRTGISRNMKSKDAKSGIISIVHNFVVLHKTILLFLMKKTHEKVRLGWNHVTGWLKRVCWPAVLYHTTFIFLKLHYNIPLTLLSHYSSLLQSTPHLVFTPLAPHFYLVHSHPLHHPGSHIVLTPLSQYCPHSHWHHSTQGPSPLFSS